MSATYDSANQFTSENFLNPYGLFMPQKRRELMYFQNEEYFSLDIFTELKMNEPVEGRTFSFFIEPKKVVNLIAAAAVSAGSTDATVDIVITNTVGISGGVYARGREVLRRRSGQQLVVLAVNTSTSTITVKAKAGGAVTAVAAGEVFTIVGNASPEASSPRIPLTGVPKEVENQLQIQQEIAQASGSVQDDKTWFNVDTVDQAGAAVNMRYWFAWEIGAAWDRLTNQRANTLVAGQKETYALGNLVSNFGANAVSTMYTTGGLISQFTSGGNSLNYQNGSLDMTWYNKLENTLVQNYGDRENMMWCGLNFSQQNASWLIDMMKNGAISYGAFNQSASMEAYTSAGASAMTVDGKPTKIVDGSALAVKMGFSSFTSPQGFTWHWKGLSEFNAPDGLGALGFGYNALVIPTAMFRTSTGKMSRPIRVRYKTLPNGGQVATGFRNSTRNSSSPNSVGDFDSIETIVEEGVEVIIPWKGWFIQPQ